MSDKPRGKTFFEVIVPDGRKVRMHKQVYYGHIVRHHPELEKAFAHPITAIESALVNAVGTRPSPSGRRLVYEGPQEFTQFLGNCVIQVVVQLEDDGDEKTGWVVTAFPRS